MKSSPILRLLSAAAIGFLIGVPFTIQFKLFPLTLVGDGNCNATFSAPFTNSSSNYTAGETLLLQSKATSASEKIALPAKPQGAERLPPKIVVRESDLHLRRLWGNPREDTPPRKYLLALAVGYGERVHVNATVHKFSDNFDVMLFHYDGRTTEWDDEFEWSKQAIHISARMQSKWWYAKRFLHPSIVAPYEYIFLWDEDLGVETFDPEEYIKIVKKHGLEISQPGLDITRGTKHFSFTVRRNDTEIHTKSTTSARNCSIHVHHPSCRGFVESMAPVFTREAWTCVWHMVQNDLVHLWNMDMHFWRCVDEPGQQIGIVDAQYVIHHKGFTLGHKGNPNMDGSRRKVRQRQWLETSLWKDRIANADRAQAAALLAQSNAIATAIAH